MRVLVIGFLFLGSNHCIAQAKTYWATHLVVTEDGKDGEPIPLELAQIDVTEKRVSIYLTKYYRSYQLGTEYLMPALDLKQDKVRTYEAIDEKDRKCLFFFLIQHDTLRGIGIKYDKKQFLYILEK